jgi:hypothetical protein
MPTNQPTHTNKDLFLIVCGILTQCILFYSDAGLPLRVLALITSCGAFAAVRFAEEAVGREREGTNQLHPKTV